jgi:probable rRNA maturation factor
MKVHVTNRQRKVSVEKQWLTEAATTLADTTLSNISRRPVAHLSPATVEQIAGRGELSLVLVSDRSIRKLNRQWRGQDSATDVLSFPLALEAPPAGPPFEIGEVVISVERAVDQASSLGHSLERELAFLFVHGTLHVLGFDHETPEEEHEMFSRQKDILDSAGFER